MASGWAGQKSLVALHLGSAAPRAPLTWPWRGTLSPNGTGEALDVQQCWTLLRAFGEAIWEKLGLPAPQVALAKLRGCDEAQGSWAGGELVGAVERV